ncbi:hypothetical protein [Mesorhizobium sp. L2C084A000]|uniref:hypothetical protein n=1 Tax=unclassified Mesorhizobium TaxID=325217 RepID=UPI0003D00A94|nr:hypothetical protein [Mesorhizobium sp. L2C084A000]ESZ29336.1 hypothetical protein X734_07835 [Mesorhizobium sp. L2C084A000]
MLLYPRRAGEQPKPWFRKELSEIKLVRRIGKVRDVGRKMLDKSTDRHAQCYRDRVTTGPLSDGQGGSAA